MASRDEEGLLPSMLDRLIDPDSGGTIALRGYTVDQMADAVRRDLEELLNTRQTHDDIPADDEELQGSVLGYGLPDLIGVDALTPQQREELGRTLEKVIARFEPRLRGIRATLLSGGDLKDRNIRFRIEARLSVEPAPEVAFETTLELTTGHHSVTHGAL